MLSEPWAQGAWAVYLCDLAPKLTEKELRQVFGFYGDIAALEHIDEASGGSALITYSSKEAAREAAATVHLASLRGELLGHGMLGYSRSRHGNSWNLITFQGVSRRFGAPRSPFESPKAR